MTNLLGVVFILIGIWLFAYPESAFDFKKSLAGKVGVKISGKKQALRVYTYIGVLFKIMGVLMFFS